MFRSKGIAYFIDLHFLIQKQFGFLLMILCIFPIESLDELKLT